MSQSIRPAEMAKAERRLSLPTLLSFNGGYVDTAGFLALQGLFTAHVTGNFVTFGASVALGASGAAAKLLALPVFCAVVILARLLNHRLSRGRRPAVAIMLGLQVALLVLGAAFAIAFGPFATGNGWQALSMGMLLVAAMAIQNTVHRLHLGSAPPSTLMTCTTTQIMIDIADRLAGLAPDAMAAWKTRILRMTVAVASFAAGCACAALLFLFAGMACFLLPPALVLVGILLHSEGETLA